MNTDEEFDFEGDEEEETFAPEMVRPPADQYEWYEAVVTEIAWLTGRTLFLTTPVNVCLQALVNRGASVEDASAYLIEKLGYKVAV